MNKQENKWNSFGLLWPHLNSTLPPGRYGLLKGDYHKGDWVLRLSIGQKHSHIVLACFHTWSLTALQSNPEHEVRLLCLYLKTPKELLWDSRLWQLVWEQFASSQHCGSLNLSTVKTNHPSFPSPFAIVFYLPRPAADNAGTLKNTNKETMVANAGEACGRGVVWS